VMDNDEGDWCRCNWSTSTWLSFADEMG
jgi:hypothetical protein